MTLATLLSACGTPFVEYNYNPPAVIEMSIQPKVEKPSMNDVQKAADEVDAQVQTSPVVLQSN